MKTRSGEDGERKLYLDHVEYLVNSTPLYKDEIRLACPVAWNIFVCRFVDADS